MQRRSTYPSDPFDLLVSPNPQQETTATETAQQPRKKNKQQVRNKPKGLRSSNKIKGSEDFRAPEVGDAELLRNTPEMRRVKNETFGLPIDVMDWARNAVYFTPGLTLSGLVEASLREHLARLEKERGEQFPERPGRIKTGRPMRS